jgi:hypothetical protein
MFMNVMFATAVVLVSLVVLHKSNNCRCIAPAPNESTRAGANENIIIAERAKYHDLKGVVRAGNGEILSDVLVEVLDRPEYLLLSYPESEEKKKGQRRIAACVVGSDGSFCFKGLPPGKYELRFSKDGGWKHTQVYVVVAPAGHKALKRGLEISMHVGT